MSDLEPLHQSLHSFFEGKLKDSSRVFHGRGHCYRGLEFITVDWFSPVLWVVIFDEIDAQLALSINDLLMDCAAKYSGIEAVIVQKRKRPNPEQSVIYGVVPETLYAQESGFIFHINLLANQNTGFFLDAKPARQWVYKNASGKRVLNLFAYTCAFSVSALGGGASQVVNVDMAKGAITTGQRNHALNNLDGKGAVFLTHNIFKVVNKLKRYGPFDVIVCDPPSFQKGGFIVEKDYVRLLKKVLPLLAPGGEALLCLNATWLGPEYLLDAMREAGFQYASCQRLPQRPDFPEQNPDLGLKMMVFSGAEAI